MDSKTETARLRLEQLNRALSHSADYVIAENPNRSGGLIISAVKNASSSGMVLLMQMERGHDAHGFGLRIDLSIDEEGGKEGLNWSSWGEPIGWIVRGLMSNPNYTTLFGSCLVRVP